jgi:hypothetical protein
MTDIEDDKHGDLLITLKRVLEREGWTATLVKRFLDPPDASAPNPIFRRAGAPMRLYKLSRVTTVEQQEAWQEASRKAQVRSTASKEIAAKKRARLIETAERLQIHVRKMPEHELVRRAIASYNAFHEELSFERDWDFDPARPTSDPTFLARIAVNFLRHHCTSYDRQLERVAGQVGVHEAVVVIRRRVYAAIAASYPEYAAECARQLAFREDGGVEAHDAEAVGADVAASSADERGWPKNGSESREPLTAVASAGHAKGEDEERTPPFQNAGGASVGQLSVVRTAREPGQRSRAARRGP